MSLFRRWTLILAPVLAAAPDFAFGNDASPFTLHVMPGFRLFNPSYRASGTGMTAAVSLCRVVGWAASSPGMVHFLRVGADGLPDEHHDVFVSRLGFRGGENCERVVTHFEMPPRPAENITICLAYSHRRCE